MLIGYSRTSTIEQEAGIEAQIRDLRATGAEKVFAEQVSSVGLRPQLDAALSYMRDGDTLVVTKIDRLARSIRDLMTVVDAIEKKGAALRILALNFDTTTPTGKLMLTMLGGIAEFEREIMLERQREGIAKAQREGRYKGRRPTQGTRRHEVEELIASGLGPAAIARQLGMARSTVYRIVAAR
jgi:DNA invertase Pin-like site-specific DNA recombinase